MNQLSNKLFGVTHDPDGTPRVIEPKSVKVGIGLAKGPAIHAYIDLEQKWVVISGHGQNAKRERFADKAKAQARYRELKRDSQDRPYPERLPYFTFTHLAASGDMEPDWDVIESHGPVPTEIDVIFIQEEPFSAAYQLWTATERKCCGDGKLALRSISMANTPEEKALATEAARRNEKYFPISECWLAGCQYSKPMNDRPAPCRAIGRLCFQLLKTPRLGATAVFNTAGYRSISQLFSSIEIFRRATRGFVAGIPLKMVLRPYRVTYNGRLVTQYAVSLEYRAESVVALKQAIVEEALKYRIAGREPLMQLEGLPAIEISESLPIPEDQPAAIAAELEIPQTIEEPGAQPNPEDDPDLGPVGALEHAWDEAEQEAVNLPPVDNGNRKISQDEVTKLYALCREKGLTDRAIFDYIGSHGFERLTEITVSALPGIMDWAGKSVPGKQGLLL
jgi:hypothetical protein